MSDSEYLLVDSPNKPKHTLPEGNPHETSNESEIDKLESESEKDSKSSEQKNSEAEKDSKSSTDPTANNNNEQGANANSEAGKDSSNVELPEQKNFEAEKDSKSSTDPTANNNNEQGANVNSEAGKDSSNVELPKQSREDSINNGPLTDLTNQPVNNNNVISQHDESPSTNEQGAKVKGKDSLNIEPTTDPTANIKGKTNSPGHGEPPIELEQEAKAKGKDSPNIEPPTDPEDNIKGKTNFPGHGEPPVGSINNLNIGTGSNVRNQAGKDRDETLETNKKANKKRVKTNKGKEQNDNVTLPKNSDDDKADPNTDGLTNPDRKQRIERQEESPSPSNNNVRRANNSNRLTKHIVGCLIIILVAYFWKILPEPQPISPIQKFADETVNIFKQFDNVELPDVNTVMNHVVVCRSAARTFQNNVALKSYGSDIAAKLRDFGEITKDAGDLLREMYIKHSSIYTLFDTEIEAMAHRLNLDLRQSDDAIYFTERLNRLQEKIKDLRQLVEKARNRILDVKDIKQSNDIYVEKGFKEAKKYTDNEKYSGDIVKAKKELTKVDGILSQLHNIAGQLEKLGKTLKHYEDKLEDVSDEIEEDDAFEITKLNVKYLERAIDNSKDSYKKFNRLSISD